MKMHWNENAYSDLCLGFTFNQERLVEERLGIQTDALLGEFIKSLITFGDGFVTVWDDDDHILGKTSKFGGFQTGVEDGMVNDEQLDLGRVELVQ
jgi:hypothetical protein